MSYLAMRSELKKIAAKKTPWYHLMTPAQSRQAGKEISRVIQRPSRAARWPGKALSLAYKGLRSGFKGKGVASKLLHGVAVADPVITAYNVVKHPKEHEGTKGRSMGESLGFTAGSLAGSRLPFVGNLIAGEAGRRLGKATGSLFDRKRNRRAE